MKNILLILVISLFSAELMAQETFFNKITLESKRILSVETETNGTIQPHDLLIQDVTGLSLDKKGNIVIERSTSNVLDIELKDGSIIDWATASQKFDRLSDKLNRGFEKASGGDGGAGGGG